MANFNFGAKRHLLASTPGWVFSGATLDFDFANNRYYQKGFAKGTVSNLLTTSRASIGLSQDLSGNWYTFQNNQPRITNKGLLVEETRTNLFLNSQAPATQTITVVSSSVYTVSVFGTSTIVLSGAGTGTVTQGSSVTFTASTTSLTCTVSGAGGAFQNAQVELGAFATSPIITAGASATRADERINKALTVATSYTLFGSGLSAPNTAAGLNKDIVCLSDGTFANNSRLLVTIAQAAQLQIRIANANTGGVGTATWNNNANGKLAASFVASSQVCSFNGSANGTGVLAVPSGLNTLDVGSIDGSSQFWNSYIYRIAYFPTALTSAQLNSITT